MLVGFANESGHWSLFSEKDIQSFRRRSAPVNRMCSAINPIPFQMCHELSNRGWYEINHIIFDILILYPISTGTLNAQPKDW